MRRRGNLQAKPRICAGYHFSEAVHPGKRQKSRRRGQLTVSEKIQVVHQVLIKHESYKEVALEHRVGIFVVF